MRAKNMLLGLIVITAIPPTFARIAQLPLVPAALSSALIYDNPMLNSASIVYRTGFTANGWGGYLSAYRVAFNGNVGSLLWEAERSIPDWSARNIVAWNPEADRAVKFDWTGITETQKRALGSDENILAYLRGNTALQTENGGLFRRRNSKLGDIINSLPLPIKDKHFGYQFLPVAKGGGALYQEYVRAKSARTAMVYVGANDGMLHAFDAATGAEKFGFIPDAVFPQLKSLSDPHYRHRYFVDGQLTEGDAYLPQGNSGISEWKTILLGSTGAGGKSIFALDVSTPGKLGAASVLWERSGGASDHDMGHVLGEAAVVRLRNGQWAALFGNGYDSVNKNATLYLVNIADGSLIKKIHAGSAGGKSLNGLSTPALLFNGNREVIAAYAGDVRGNVWKFDLGDSDASKRRVADNGQPLFIARDRSGKAQPIVQQPVMARHPLGGRMVMFGTGKLFEIDDAKNRQFQTMYAIWDKPNDSTTVNISDLQIQTLSRIAGTRTISRNFIDWSSRRGWYVDLLNPGERVMGKLQIINGLLVILTYTPEDSANAPSSELMMVDYMSGSAALQKVFLASLPDQIGMPVPLTISTPTVLTLPSGRRGVVINGLDGKAEVIPITVAPRLPFRTWHELPAPY
ncbi:pilus assembly protein [Glaciimonas sp. GG7]